MNQPHRSGLACVSGFTESAPTLSGPACSPTLQTQVRDKVKLRQKTLWINRKKGGLSVFPTVNQGNNSAGKPRAVPLQTVFQDLSWTKTLGLQSQMSWGFTGPRPPLSRSPVMLGLVTVTRPHQGVHGSCGRENEGNPETLFQAQGRERCGDPAQPPCSAASRRPSAVVPFRVVDALPDL